MVPEIDLAAAAALLAEEGAVFVDIRDPGSFAAGHIPGAIPATPDRIEALLASTGADAAIVVYCYHGNSSKSATAWFHQRGFTGAKSMTGGFTAWQTAAMNDEAYPVAS